MTSPKPLRAADATGRVQTAGRHGAAAPEAAQRSIVRHSRMLLCCCFAVVIGILAMLIAGASQPFTAALAVAGLVVVGTVVALWTGHALLRECREHTIQGDSGLENPMTTK
ncbi:hypothetical protein ACIBL3_12185 [Kribbella sp. NPDC050124]|uniref:hypothetical protein n=1 Tax=Kribbella sp. NPDC050124 TaxID=3364114 RepID=UPI0037B0D006